MVLRALRVVSAGDVEGWKGRVRLLYAGLALAAAAAAGPASCPGEACVPVCARVCPPVRPVPCVFSSSLEARPI